jgi:hypothetical protein
MSIMDVSVVGLLCMVRRGKGKKREDKGGGRRERRGTRDSDREREIITKLETSKIGS